MIILDDIFGNSQRNVQENKILSDKEKKEIVEEFSTYDDPEKCPHNHVQPRLGWENSIIGEHCTQCGSDFDNYGKLVEHKTVHNSTLDSQSKGMDGLMDLMSRRNIKQ